MSVTESLTKRKKIELKKREKYTILGTHGHMRIKFYFLILMTETRYRYFMTDMTWGKGAV